MRAWSMLYNSVPQLFETACNRTFWNEEYTTAFQIHVTGR